MIREAFYDLGVHAYPEGGSTLSLMALKAKEYGYAGLCTVNHSDFFLDVKKVPVPEGVEVVQGVEVVARDANDLRRQVDRFRKKVRVLAVHGGDAAINRAACEEERVDILMHPQDGKTGGLNHVLARLAADKGVAIGFELLPIIYNKGGSRVRTLSGYRANLALAKKYGAPFVVVSGAMSIYDMRDVRTALSLCRLLGMGEKDAIRGLSFYPSEILRRSSPGYIMEGVQVIG
ncbi:RNase P/RNase MRP subunit p30 [Methanocella conradii HZ254]|uniref:Ribonuclease P protein component 3 n=1 Tax=Methanocella conradii (strain DSM 24694 / JCM 17849 / CGMCC 1.5162 / HZ254) TaxID=1041930 RepID=H8IA55_METCZ|nr:ribonuclease P protein component 3 [Methanocella conradii]AFC99121.1 RNase P/RNase MRP subunit p30 [Methanocella conradii HZ254]